MKMRPPHVSSWILALIVGMVCSHPGDDMKSKPERIPVAFVFWYVPDHAGAEPYWHDPGTCSCMRLHPVKSVCAIAEVITVIDMWLCVP